MSIDSTAQVERRSWRLFRSRFLKQAETPETQEQIAGQMEDKLARLDRRGQRTGHLRQVIDEAAELWRKRANLRKRDVVYLAASLLYFISPFDAVPDIFPGVGYVDDVLVVSTVVGIILKTLSPHGRQRVEDWIDERTAVVCSRIDESATDGFHKAIAAVVIGLWGMTTAAAISLSVATALGQYPLEWITYVVLSTVFIGVCNAWTAAYFWRQYRDLDGHWQKRISSLVRASFKLRHAVAIGLPILALLGLGIARAAL